jgi:glutamate-1-semialdehyde 2,1-aminomutase
MAASLATLKLIRETDYLERTQALGQRLRSGLDEVAGRHGFALRQTGPAEMPLIMVDDDPALAKGYFWNQALIKRGVYFHPWHNMFICAAMTEADIDFSLEAADDAFKLLKAAGPLEAPTKLAFMHQMLEA